MVFKSKSKHYKKSKRSMSRKNKKNSKKISQRNTRKTQKKVTKRMRGGNAPIAGCDYIKVEGMNLPGLVIENKMALIDAGCKSTQPTLSAGEHPNMLK
jgi:hypothetical protein